MSLYVGDLNCPKLPGRKSSVATSCSIIPSRELVEGSIEKCSANRSLVSQPNFTHALNAQRKQRSEEVRRVDFGHFETRAFKFVNDRVCHSLQLFSLDDEDAARGITGDAVGA
jgi:hypothetical protein